MKIIINLIIFGGLLFSSIDINMTGVKKLTTLKGISKKIIETNKIDLTIRKCK